MPRCCGNNTATLIQQASGIAIVGTGTVQDPYVIAADLDLAVADTTVFNLTLTGSGGLADPWTLSVAYASTAKLDDVPDVNAPAPSNAQVLGWDSATSKWTPRNPTTAAAGSVTTDVTLTGDGSGGDPLSVNTDPDGFLDGAAAGLGLSDEGKVSIIQHFGNVLARDSELTSPALNQVTMLDDHPGQQDYWTGSQWQPVTAGIDRDFDTQFLSFSGGYVAGTPVTMVTKNLNFTTDSNGLFEALSVSDVAGYAGVVICLIQERGSIPFKAMVQTTVDHVNGKCYRVDTGEVYANQALQAMILAILY
jgi:hypothetical protein